MKKVIVLLGSLFTFLLHAATWTDTNGLTWEYTVAYEEVTLTDMSYKTLPSKDITVPSEIYGMPVVAIGTHTFAYHSLETVTLPDSVRELKKEAFYFCFSLKRVRFGRGMMFLENGCFLGSGGFTLDVGMSEFKYNCEALHDCVSKFEADAENEKYVTIDGALIDRELKMLLWAPRRLSEYTVPEGVTAIGEYCFTDWKLKRLEIPPTVTFFDGRVYSTTYQRALNELIAPVLLEHCKTVKLTIPEGVTVLQTKACDGFYPPSIVELPVSIGQIEADAFSPKVQRVIFRGPPPEVVDVFPQMIGVYTEAYAEQWQEVIVDGCWNGLIMRTEDEADPNAQLFKYTVEDGEATICGLIGTLPEGELVIPSFIEGYPVKKIAERAFANTWVKNVRVSGGIKEIGGSAFSSSALVSIVLEEGVESIGDGAFYGCQELENVDIPDSLKVIGEDLFNPYNKLPVIDGVIYESKEKRRILIGYPSWNGESSPFVGDYKVDETVRFIATGAFMQAWDLTSVELPEGLLGIGRSAFGGCYSLHTLNLPESLLSISGGAFEHCPLLTSLVIPKGVTTIGWSTFSMCSGLQSIELHDGITEIGLGAFDGCSSLTQIQLPAGLQKIESCTFRDCSMLESITIPETVTSIGIDAFRNCGSMRSFNIPTNVTEIGAEAFWGCYNAQCAVHIPGSVSRIEPYTFMGCGWLTEITFEEGVTTIGEGAFSGATFNITSLHLPDTITSVGRDAFGGMNNVSDLKLSKNLKVIESGAFTASLKLLCVKLPEGVETVESNAFSGEAVALLDLPASLKTFAEPNWYEGVSRVIFRGAPPPDCVNFNEGLLVEGVGIYFPEYAEQWEAVIVDGKWKNLTMKVFTDEMVTVDYICQKESWNVNQSTYTIRALNTDKEHLTIPTEIDGIPVTKIGDSAFANAQSLVSVVIPDSVTSIGSYAFEHCPNLESVIIGDGVESIGDDCFNNCPKLTNITLGKNVKEIHSYYFFEETDNVYFTVHPENEHYYAFDGALVERKTQTLLYARAAYGEFVIPEGVKRIHELAFNTCEVTRIVFPTTLKSMNAYGFYGGKNHPDLVFLGPPPASYSLSFSPQQYGYYHRTNTTAWTEVIVNGKWKGMVMIPFDALEELTTNVDVEYQVQEGAVTIVGTKVAGDELVIPSEINGRPVIAIAADAFKNNTTLKSVTLPEGLLSIGANAFAGCTSLQEVTLPNGLQTFATGAFQGCTALTTVTFPFGLETIGASAFEGCEQLDGVALPMSVRTIEKNAFKNCVALQQCSLNDGLTTIREGAFEGTSALRVVVFPASLTTLEKGAFKDCTRLMFVAFHGAPPTVVATESAGEETTVFSGSVYDIYGSYPFKYLQQWWAELNALKWESVTMIMGGFSFDIGASNTDLRRWLEGVGREQGYDEGNFTFTLAADTDYETLDMARLLGVYPKISRGSERYALSTLADIEEAEDVLLSISADVQLSVSEIVVSEDEVAFDMCISTTKGVLPKTFNPLIMPQLLGAVSVDSAYVPLAMDATSSWVVNEDKMSAIKQVKIPRGDYKFFKFYAE